MNNLEMYTSEEVQELLHISDKLLLSLRTMGCLHPIKLGKGYMYSQEDLKSFQREFAGMDLSNAVMISKAVKEKGW